MSFRKFNQVAIVTQRPSSMALTVLEAIVNMQRDRVKAKEKHEDACAFSISQQTTLLFNYLDNMDDKSFRRCISYLSDFGYLQYSPESSKTFTLTEIGIAEVENQHREKEDAMKREEHDKLTEKHARNANRLSFVALALSALAIIVSVAMQFR